VIELASIQKTSVLCLTDPFEMQVVFKETYIPLNVQHIWHHFHRHTVFKISFAIRNAVFHSKHLDTAENVLIYCIQKLLILTE